MLKSNLIIFLILVILTYSWAFPPHECKRTYERFTYLLSYNYYGIGSFDTCVCLYPVIFDYYSDNVDSYEHDGILPKLDCQVLFMGSGGTTLPPNIFSENSQLQQIYLNGSNLHTIQPGAFNGLMNLQHLYLEHNDLSNITEGSLNSLSNLEFLHLDRNQITFITDYAFMGLNQLIVLTLSSNRLTYLSKGLLKPLLNLQLLDISNNPFKIIDRANLILKALYLQNIGFNEIAESNNYLIITNKDRNLTLEVHSADLVELDLSYNNILQLDKFSFKQAHNMTFLNFSFNLVEDIDADVFNDAYSLVNLDLSNNNIKELPFGVFNSLSFLTYLNLSHNQIEHLSYGYFENLRKLRVLNLSYNSINKFNYLRSRYDDNIKLYVDNNNLSDLDSKIFARLDEISLDGNMWDCETLSNIIEKLETLNINLLNGTTYKTENVYNIACSNPMLNEPNFNTPQIKNFSHNLNNAFSNLIKQFDNSKFIKFFNSDFKNSRFFNFFKNFNATILTNYVTHQIALNVSNYQNSTGNLNVLNTLEALKADKNADDNTNIYILNALNFALYIILVISCFYLITVVKKINRLNMVQI